MFENYEDLKNKNLATIESTDTGNVIVLHTKRWNPETGEPAEDKVDYVDTSWFQSQLDYHQSQVEKFTALISDVNNTVQVKLAEVAASQIAVPLVEEIIQ